MTFPNDVSRVAQGVANYSGSSKDIANAKAAARTLIRETCVLRKEAVDGAASTTTAYTAADGFKAPRAGRLLGASANSRGTLTASDTTNAVIDIVKADGAGGSATAMSTLTTNVASGNWVAGGNKTFTNAAIAATRFTAGQWIGFQIAKGSTGVAVPISAFTLDIEWEDVDGYGV